MRYSQGLCARPIASSMDPSNSTSYTVSARKYRPQHWDTVVGQDGITQTLKQAIEHDQIAQAYLFCGPRGVGKTTSARIFARAINGFEADSSEDYAFNVFELDAASNNKVEDIRSIVDQVRIPPQRGKYKVYVIDEVHMLSQAAFNAFLKTLEEPPAHAVFILATTEKHKILPTILSRCQIFDFHRIGVQDMVQHLQGICEKEGIEAEESALHIVAVKADGALRDALSIFDQLVAFAGKKLTHATVAEHLHVLDQQTYFDVVDALRSGAMAQALMILDGIIVRGFDPHHFVTGLGGHLRNLLVCKDASTLSLLEVTEDVKQQFAAQSQAVDIRFLIRSMELVNQADVQYKSSNHQRLLVELTLMQMATPDEGEKKKPELIPIHQHAWKQAPQPEQATSSPAESRTPATSADSVEQVAIEPFQVNAADAARATGAVRASDIAPDRDRDVVRTEMATPGAVPGGANGEGTSASREGANQVAVDEQSKPPQDIGMHSIQDAGKSMETHEEVDVPSGPVTIVKRKLKLKAPETLVSLPKNEEKPKAPAVIRNQPVDDASLARAWKDFVAGIETAGQLNLLSTLMASQVALEEGVVVISVLNKLQEEQIRGCQMNLMVHLSEALQNDVLNLEVRLKSFNEGESSSEFLNDRERYDRMVQKNPILDSLRHQLDLDLLG